MSFYVGQKIVCIDNAIKNAGATVVIGIDGIAHGTTGNMDGLQTGQIYSIRDFGVCWDTGGLGIFLNEIIRPLEGAPVEVPYRATRFRPLIERKTDISALQRICDDITNKQPVKV